MLKKTKIIIGISSAVGIAAIATTAIVTPLTQISNQNSKVSDDQFSIEKVSNVWNDVNKETEYVDKEFKKMLNFDSNDSNNIKDNLYKSVLYSIGNNEETKNNKIMLEMSKKLKSLNKNQQNQVKNQMLKMTKIISIKNLIQRILLKF